MEKHFVRFFSPGTFIAETTEKAIDSWDVEQAIKMSKEITERHNSKPYGFVFFTRTRSDDDLDSKVTKTSPMYYLGGTVCTLQQLKDKNDPNDRILISNMQCNGWDRVIENSNSWRVTRPLEAGDIVLDVIA